MAPRNVRIPPRSIPESSVGIPELIGVPEGDNMEVISPSPIPGIPDDYGGSVPSHPVYPVPDESEEYGGLPTTSPSYPGSEDTPITQPDYPTYQMPNDRSEFGGGIQPILIPPLQPPRDNRLVFPDPDNPQRNITINVTPLVRAEFHCDKCIRELLAALIAEMYKHEDRLSILHKELLTYLVAILERNETRLQQFHTILLDKIGAMLAPILASLPPLEKRYPIYDSPEDSPNLQPSPIGGIQPIPLPLPLPPVERLPPPKEIPQPEKALPKPIQIIIEGDRFGPFNTVNEFNNFLTTIGIDNRQTVINQGGFGQPIINIPAPIVNVNCEPKQGESDETVSRPTPTKPETPESETNKGKACPYPLDYESDMSWVLSECGQSEIVKFWMVNGIPLDRIPDSKDLTKVIDELRKSFAKPRG